MDINEAREKYLDYLDNNLSPEDHNFFEKTLGSNADLNADFEDYKKLIVIEAKIASEEFKAGGDFSARVLEKIENEALHDRWSAAFGIPRFGKKVFASVATFAIAGMAILLTDSGLIEQSLAPIPMAENSRSVVTETAAVSDESVAAVGTASEIVEPQKPSPAALVENTRRESVSFSSSSRSVEAEPGIPDLFEKRLSQYEDSHKRHKTSAEAKHELGKKAIASVDNGFKDSVSRADFFEGFARTEGVSEGSSRASALSSKELTGQALAEFDIREERRRLLEAETKHDPTKPFQFERYETQQFDQSKTKKLESAQTVVQPVVEVPLSYVQTVSLGQEATASESGENKTVLVAEKPVSIFRIDVNTESFRNVRRFLNAGQLPPKNLVQIEELINFFNYNYAKQTEQPFSVQYELAPSPLQADKFLLKLGVCARDIKQVDIKPWNLVFLIDTSESMANANRLAHLKYGLKMLVSKMREEDSIALVTYGTAAATSLNPTSGRERLKIFDAIDQLQTSGNENGLTAIDLAYQIALQNKKTGSINQVVLATDGNFDVGAYNYQALTWLIESKRKSDITLTTVGFSVDSVKGSNLSELASKGNGNYFNIDSFQVAGRILGIQLVPHLELVAKDVKSQIDFNPDLVSEYRLIGYDSHKPSRETPAKNKVEGAEIESGHTTTVVYEIAFKVPEPVENVNAEVSSQQPAAVDKARKKKVRDPNEVALVKISYKRPKGDAAKPQEFPLLLQNKLASSDQASDDFRFVAAVIYFANILKESQYRGDYKIQDVIDLARKSAGNDQFGFKQEFIKLLEKGAMLFERQEKKGASNVF